MEPIKFKDICAYVKAQGEKYKEREKKDTRVKDMTGNKYKFYDGSNLIVLYEGEKRTFRGHLKPQVNWVCISETGHIVTLQSEVLKKLHEVYYFSFCDSVRRTINKWLNEHQSKS